MVEVQGTLSVDVPQIKRKMELFVIQNADLDIKGWDQFVGNIVLVDLEMMVLSVPKLHLMEEE